MNNFFKKGTAIVLATAVVLSSMMITQKKENEVKASEDYELVWSDEFDGDSLNRNNWNVEVHQGYNNEREYYVDSTDNIFVSDGTLKLRAIKKQYNGQPYTSGRINTLGKVDFTYGKVEARIKLPSFAGSWPAFWMKGANQAQGVKWPLCGEIDIMEVINTRPIVYANAHWPIDESGAYNSSGWDTNKAGFGDIDVTQWHTYSFEWDENKMVWYLDGKSFHEVPIGDDPVKEAFTKPQFVLLNLAVGGDWPEGDGTQVDENALPATMEVDYVRAYKKIDSEETYTGDVDSLRNYSGTWQSNIITSKGAAGTVAEKENPKEGFVADITALGSDRWAAQTWLANVDYVAGNRYNIKSTLISNVDKNVYIKIQGDSNSTLAASTVSLKANQPYYFEKDLDIPEDYTGTVSLYYAYGGGIDGESTELSVPMSLEVKDVEFYTEDSLGVYSGIWNSIIGQWSGAAGNVDSQANPKDGFKADLSAVGSGTWGVQTSLQNLSYIAGNDYSFKCTLNSSIDKNVYIKVQGDDNATLAADTISLKAGESYSYQRTLWIPEDYTGTVSLYYAYGGGIGGESMDASVAMNFKVENVEFYIDEKIEEPTTEETTAEESATEEITTEEMTTQGSTAIDGGININGYQIGTSVQGVRTVYSVENKIDNKDVVGVGMIYSLSDYATEDELYVGSSNLYVRSFEGTTNGVSSFNFSGSATATSYVMTMRFKAKTAKEYTTKWRVRAFAKLSDGTYVYSKAYEYTIHAVAESLYQNVQMNTLTAHNYLYTNILKVVDPMYEEKDYDWGNEVVKLN